MPCDQQKFDCGAGQVQSSAHCTQHQQTGFYNELKQLTRPIVLWKIKADFHFMKSRVELVQYWLELDAVLVCRSDAFVLMRSVPVVAQLSF